jgi:hypothetical protein
MLIKIYILRGYVVGYREIIQYWKLLPIYDWENHFIGKKEQEVECRID